MNTDIIFNFEEMIQLLLKVHDYVLESILIDLTVDFDFKNNLITFFLVKQANVNTIILNEFTTALRKYLPAGIDFTTAVDVLADASETDGYMQYEHITIELLRQNNN